MFMLTLAFLIAAPAVDAKSTRVERKISLASTGAAPDASGHARFRERGSRQDFKVEVEARVKTGTKYTVYVVNSGQTVKAGVIKINRLGEGEIELKNYDGKRLPAGIAPVSSITQVIVKDSKGTVILTGSF
jgi:hypothetical protein